MPCNRAPEAMANATLLELGLSGYNIRSDGANKVLQTLNIVSNNIGDQGAAAFEDALKVNSTLISQPPRKWDRTGRSPTYCKGAGVCETCSPLASLRTGRIRVTDGSATRQPTHQTAVDAHDILASHACPPRA
eukprot:g51769.t1